MTVQRIAQWCAMGVAAALLTSCVAFRKDGGRVEIPVPADEHTKAMEARQREEAVLGATEQAIKAYRMSPASVVVVDEEGHPVPGASVTIELVRHEFLFGCNIYMFDRFKTPEENRLYKEHFDGLFNYATTGFYWSGYEPERGKPRYPYTDKVVAWCAERGIRTKGHPLLWDHEAGVPAWSDGQPAAEVQRERVTDILARYADTIEFWEVVNEPSHCRGVTIDEPYRWARAASPEAYLIVNDYRVLANGCRPFRELLEEAVDNGVPFDGIGIQAHEPRNMAFALDRVQSILDTYAALGKELHVTEFTPCSNGLPVIDSRWRGVWDEAQQADYAEKFYRVCFAHPAIVAITWWDLCDNGSWLENGGMLRKDLSPKPVYDALMKLIHEEWTTRLSAKTDRSGRIGFAGFHGRYRVTAETNGVHAEGEYHLAKDRDNEFALAMPAGP